MVQKSHLNIENTLPMGSSSFPLAVCELKRSQKNHLLFPTFSLAVINPIKKLFDGSNGEFERDLRQAPNNKKYQQNLFFIRQKRLKYPENASAKHDSPAISSQTHVTWLKRPKKKSKKRRKKNSSAVNFSRRAGFHVGIH